MQTDRLGRADISARVISRLTNPCFLSIGMLLLVAYISSSSLRALLSWGLTILLFLVLLPLFYVDARMLAQGNSIEDMDSPLDFLRWHPVDIYILGLISALPCILVLVFLEAPSFLIGLLVALLVTSLAVAVVNMFYRASYHLAAVTSLAVIVSLTWRQAFPLALAIVPLVGWARYRLEQHTPGQLVTGFGLAVAVSLILYWLGLSESFVI